ncbi:MAG: ATP-binding protein [Patescibacteria group bacterium]
MNLFLFISALVNGIVALTVGTVIYFRKRNQLIHQTFAIFCFAIAFWAFGSFWPLTTNNSELSLLSFRILHVGAFFLAIANFHFVCAVLGITRKNKLLIRGGYILSTLLLPLISTKFFIEGVAAKNGFTFWVEPGMLYHLWIVIWLAYFARAFYLLRTFYKKNEGIKKQQIKYIYLGEVVSFSALVINFLPAYNLSVPIYFNILLAGQITAFAYAILRYRYLDVQLSLLGIAKKILALLISLGLGLGISYVIFFRREQLSVLMLFPIISLATYFSLSNFFNSRFFYRLLGMKHLDDITKAVGDFYKKRIFYTSLPELLNSVHIIFIEKLKISAAEVVLLNPGNLKLFAPLSDYFQKSKGDYLPLQEFLPEGKEKELDKIQKLGMFCFPLWGENGKLVGFFFLGHKPRQKTYTHKELQILKAAAVHISLSLKISNYSADLQNEVARKTKQLKAKSQKLRCSYQKLQELDHAKDSFFAVTSHDLRTPMTIIKGYNDFLISEKFGRLNMKQRDFLERIRSGSESILSLINSILEFSKLEAGRMEFNFVKTELLPVIENIVKDFKVKCAEKSIEFNFENPENLNPKIVTDEDKIKRVTLNLLGNAFKFTPKNGRITIRLTREREFLKFEIIDNGIGVAKKDQKVIFERFSQVQNYLQKSYQGTGLGLSIVKGIVEKLNGRVWVESRVGHGSNFIFTIPLELTPSKIQKADIDSSLRLTIQACNHEKSLRKSIWKSIPCETNRKRTHLSPSL